MTLNKAYNFFESLLSETEKKSEIKVYQKFLYILNGLKTREFSEDEMQSIETELDSLNLTSNNKNKKRYFRKTLSKFEKYLETTFSLISKGYYTNMGVGIGSSFGILFGVVFLSSFDRSLGISLGLIFGMLIGSTMGKKMDSNAAAEGRVL